MNIFKKSKNPLSYNNNENIKYRVKINKVFFQKELSKFLNVDLEWIKAAFYEYAETPDAWTLLSSYQSPSRQYDGKAKSVDIAEGFSVWAFVKKFRPKNVVELGSQYGISSKLWKEALKKYVPEHSLHLFDLEDKRRYISDQEATLHKGDAYRLFPEFIRENKISVLINDAHPYELIKWSLFEGIKYKVPYYAFHDIGMKSKRGPFKPEFATLTEYEKVKGSQEWHKFGTWERHVMAEVFDKRILKNDFVENTISKTGIFDSFLGYGFIIDKTVKNEKL